ncbi:competence protein [Helicobacter suis]|uniref:competence protein n=1 Tax=Helicobacter suis TaxID=104628 RepID=UPI00248FE18C|nr:competence protein [Helicobacter suis]
MGIQKILTMLCLVIFSPMSIFALSILTTDNINLKQRIGSLQGRVVFGEKVFLVQAIGQYHIRGKALELEITDLIRNNQKLHLSQNARTTQNIPPNLWIRKGSLLHFSCENADEIAKILGVSSEEYKQLENSTDCANATSNASTENNKPSGVGAGIDKQGVIGVDGSSGTSSYTDGNVGGFNNNSFQNSSSGSSNDGSSLQNFSNGGSLNNGIYPLPLPTESGGNNSNTDSGIPSSSATDSTNLPYSMQYCKVPEFDAATNQFKLFVIGKDGTCQEMNAYRDDTKCSYRYDFEKGKAIKQTQFYYVDKENKTQYIGGCVDLHGAQYAMQLYKDDSKCTLSQTSDKDYGMGQSQSFQTQIVFRGMDNLLHVAIDCADYARVQDRIVRYEKNSNTKQMTPIVDQYYEDPITKKQVILNRGVESKLSSQYQEYACGKWVYDDAKLQAYRPTMLKSYDAINGVYIEVTPCDFESGIKSGKITVPYAKLPATETTLDTKTTSHQFFLTLAREHSGVCYNVRQHNCPIIDSNANQAWASTYVTTTTEIKQPYQRPAQDGETPTIYTITTQTNAIKRSTQVSDASIGLSDLYMQFVEVQEGYYKDNTIKTSEKFLKWQQASVRPGNGSCEQLEMVGDYMGSRVKEWVPNMYTRCSRHGQYVYDSTW